MTNSRGHLSGSGQLFKILFGAGRRAPADTPTAAIPPSPRSKDDAPEAVRNRAEALARGFAQIESAADGVDGSRQFQLPDDACKTSTFSGSGSAGRGRAYCFGISPFHRP